ncbi:Alpha/Beta hydrolase protein [Truncatella angustata]|uniref:Alpha/Beta hydrolase protein n=1 Tax=Truncatella angustata TaxID=152316 RepID=A0A9P8U9P4_9PEZI|nr:Alpha/Beta hydrolase protein [Truncatella angustata]KAH6646534.1 Alpha/Beta hydrolase protein [Truncatella angustata]
MSVYSPSGGNYTEYFPLNSFSENCLTLNVWAPSSSETKLPVIVWFFGGGFVQGGTNSPYFNPQAWVQRTQKHIMVTVNFRSNIFGFPNAMGLMKQNLGLLDQRLALEWVRDNIANFGGNPAKIVGWGESGGAEAVDYLNFAYPSDPIYSGTILDSATALFPRAGGRTFDTAQTNFTAVAAALGCHSTSSEINCLRGVTWQAIEAVLSADPTLKFLPIVDNVTVFQNYSDRYAINAISSVPALIGTNLHEFNEGIPTPLSPTFNQSASDKNTIEIFLCTAALTSQARQSHSLTTYRYRYDGNFSNISPSKYSGAYHAAELPLIFGTAGDFHGVSTAYENAVSRSMQDLWLDFARDPEYGLRISGWGTYDQGKAVILGDEDEPVKGIDVSQLDGVCDILPVVI